LNAEASGLEENARTIRYQFLDEAARKSGCQTIALAHTADDQAETVLHHLLRGTGIAGLRGIPLTRLTAAKNRLIRPILGARRSDVESYLSGCGQSYRTDNTNTDTTMTRNKLRHVILPMLRDQVNPQVDAALGRLAEQAIDIDEFLQQSVDQLIEECVIDRQPDGCRIDVTRLNGQSRHLIRSFFCEIWNRQNWPRQAMGFEQWNRIVEMIHTRETITLPNRIEARFHSESLLVLRRL
jgi:tRNA(Ile)-lysidine synthase